MGRVRYDEVRTAEKMSVWQQNEIKDDRPRSWRTEVLTKGLYELHLDGE